MMNQMRLYNNWAINQKICLQNQKNLVIEEEQEELLHEYCMSCSDHIYAQWCGSKLQLCRCSHYRVSKPEMDAA